MINRFRFPHRAFCAAGAIIALATAFRITEARADFTFNLGNLSVDTNRTLGNIALTGAPAGTYNSYQVTTNWVAATGGPYSREAQWKLISTADGLSGTTYADPGASANGTTNSNPVMLSWSANLTTPYSGGNLFFNPFQTFMNSTASWNNTVITLKNAAISFPPPPSTTFTLPTALGSKYTDSGALGAGQIVWHDFVYNGGGLSLDTFGSALTGGSMGTNDTEIAVYNSLGNLIDNNDQAFGDDFTNESLLNFNPGDLTTGERYYIAVGAFNTTFLDGFGATSTSAATGTYRLNVTVVPEAGALPLLLSGLLGAGVVARRRKSA